MHTHKPDFLPQARRCNPANPLFLILTMKKFIHRLICPDKGELLLFVLLFFNSMVFSQTPVASYPFNGNANDASGNGNNGILSGESANPVLTADRFGNPNSAYQFGGYYNKNWIRVPNSSSLKLNNQLSISLWFNQCSFAGMDGYGGFSTNGYHILISKAGDGISANPGFDTGIQTDTKNLLQLYFGNTNGYGPPRNFDAATKINCFDTCEWIHFVVVVNNDKLQMYFNGRKTLDQTINPADFTNANTQDLFIGRMNGGGRIWYPFNGKIDDVNIYSIALTQAQVTTLMGSYRSPLAVNNTITLDSLITNLACGSDNGSISIYPNSNNAPYQFSIDGGVTYQSSGIFPGLGVGKYNVKIKTFCNQKDTVVNIETSISITKSLTLCQGQSYLGHAATGKYVDNLKTAKGCDSIITTNLTVNPRPVANFTVLPDVVSIIKPEVSFTDKSTGSPPLTWQWSLGNGDSSDLRNFNYTYTDTGKFKVTLLVKNQYGCADSISTHVTVQSGYSIFIPNVFTPNGDGINDTFGPVTKGVSSLEMSISDRSGRIVHKIDQVNGRWDGLMPSGSAAPQGVYFYLLRALGYDELEYIRQGNVNLYRDQVNLVPNPVKSSAVLNFIGRLTGEKTISVYTAAGMLIRTFNTTEDIVYLDLTSLNPGLYFLKASDSSQRIDVKFIKE